MKNLIITLLMVSYMSISMHIDAQQSNEDTKYRRSSLEMILLESKDFPNKNAVMASWDGYPFPDKYNEHDIISESFNINEIVLNQEDLLKAGFSKDLPPTAKQLAKLKVDQIIKDQNVAKKMIAMWFNRSLDGKFDMSLIQERGFYNASELEASVAEGQARGLASLGDAGVELIRNTFVTFTALDFYENEPFVRAIRDEAINQINSSEMEGFAKELAIKAAEKVYEKTKEGYSLWSATWLYQLNWNDSIAAVFYNDLWADPIGFDNSNIFSLEFVNVQYNQSLVTFKIGEKRTKEELIDIVLVRNVDNAFAKLQKKNEIFKPMVPVLTANPITAKIGMKEGLKGGEKFNVLEMTLNSETGLTEYKQIGTVKADKKSIWDNRYNAGGKNENEKFDKQGNLISVTLFKGGKNIQPGMLLKQAK